LLLNLDHELGPVGGVKEWWVIEDEVTSSFAALERKAE
jgi:hypothetical protein